MSTQDRYSRQIRFAPLGAEGQRRIAGSTVLLVGVGALGSHLADTLVRAGVGRIVLVDRDIVELSNL
ncbi:MAG: ThiF family adenylyltransferase, partial [Planctomycetota bacterium]